jgi:hypothetical protein
VKVRYEIDGDSGVLVDRDGNELGRLVSLRLDFSGKGGGGVGGSITLDPSLKVKSVEQEVKGTTALKDEGVGEGSERRPTASELEREVVHHIWSYWVEISGKTRAQLDTKRERHIRNALRLGFSADEIKLALLGVWRSPFHQGENEQRKKYLDLHYALRGKGDESDDTRIELAMMWAAVYAPATTNAQRMSEHMVKVHLENMRYTASLDHHPEYKRAKLSYNALKSAGFEVQMLKQSPWVRLSR